MQILPVRQKPECSPFHFRLSWCLVLWRGSNPTALTRSAWVLKQSQRPGWRAEALLGQCSPKEIHDAPQWEHSAVLVCEEISSPHAWPVHLFSLKAASRQSVGKYSLRKIHERNNSGEILLLSYFSPPICNWPEFISRQWTPRTSGLHYVVLWVAWWHGLVRSSFPTG